MTEPPVDRWEHFHHQADIGIRGFGSTLAGAFEQAAYALTAVIITAPVKPTRRLTITSTGDDPELLLADWLNKLIYLMAFEKMLFGRFNVKISGNSLTAQIFGEAVDVERHQPTIEIKAATYAELKVRQLSSRHWLAQCVVDV